VIDPYLQEMATLKRQKRNNAKYIRKLEKENRRLTKLARDLRLRLELTDEMVRELEDALDEERKEDHGEHA